MKKYLLTLLILSTFSLSSHAFLPEKLPNFEHLVSEVDLAKKNKPPKTPSLGKTLGKGYIATKVWKHKGKIAIAGIGGLIVYGISKSKFLDIIANPENYEEYMQEMLEDKLKTSIAFQSVVFYNYLKTDDEEFKEQLEYFIDYFNLIKKTEENQIKTNNKEFKLIQSKIVNKTKIIYKKWINDEGYNRCNQIFYNMLSHEKRFRPLPDIYLNTGGNIYDVNSYLVLTEEKIDNTSTADHIPSYKSVEIYLKRKGVTLSEKRSQNNILVENLTSILIKSEDHQLYSITFGKNNTYKLNTEKRYEYDANNLLKATIRDLSFFAMHLDTNSQEKYLKSSEILIERNFYLCLYDIGENYDFTKLYN